MPFLIDTNIFIYAREGNAAVRQRFLQHDGSLFLSALSLAELQRGLDPRQPEAALRRARHQVLVQRVVVVPFDGAAAEAYGHVLLHKGRTKSHDVDHMIAAHALSTNSILVTNNEIDFDGIPGLVLQNWVSP